MKVYNLENAIREKENATQLCIHRRKLTDFPSTLFSLPKLRSLELSQNSLTHLPEQLLQLTSLEELIITDNQLQIFPAFLSRFPNLKVIKLNGNLIKEWPSFQNNFHQLEHLSLSKNQLKELPDSFESFVNLKTLSLSHNQIESIPESICQLHLLRKLFLQHNQIGIFPKDLLACKQLGELHLQYNQLQKLPLEIGQLDQLYRLNLANNRIKELPDSISKCSFLSHVNFSHNKLQQLPSSLATCSHFRELDFSHNQLTTLPSPSGWRQLRKWIVDHNQIQQLPEGLKDLHYLEQLSLKKNPVTGFFPELLSLFRLRRLEGLMKAADRRLLLRFLSICKKKRIDLPERKKLYALLNKEDTLYGRPFLLRAATLGIKALKEQAIHQLIEQHSRSIKAYPLSKKSRVSLLGRSRLKIKELEEAFKQKGIDFQRNINPDTTHIILGQQWSEGEELPEQDFVFLRETQVFDLLHTQEGGYLNEASQQQLARLKTLLCSREDSRIEIALQVLKGGGLPSSLFTEVFIAWKTAQNKRLRNELYNLLRWKADEATRLVLSARWSLAPKLGVEKITANIARYAEGTQLEEAILLQFFCSKMTNG